ncbi:MAG: response regulator [Patescibacteria group bacterium]|nr:response regulator [Patescibacteria group bacterium]
MFGMKKKTLGKGKKILIVEDDSLLAKVLSESFLIEKFRVVMVNNGLDAAKAVKTFLPDIILLDLIIPGLDGFAVLKQLKSDAKTKNIPVAVISNLSDVGDVKSTKALGADEYFIKANTEMDKIVKYVKNKLKV